jgi:hypothetical protein
MFQNGSNAALRNDVWQALSAYRAFYAAVPALRAAFPYDALDHLDLLLDALHEEILAQLQPSTIDDVNSLPTSLQAPAIVALIDRTKAAAHDEILLDWYRYQIMLRPDLVRRLLSDAEAQTPAEVLRWLAENAIDPDEDPF